MIALHTSKTTVLPNMRQSCVSVTRLLDNNGLTLLRPKDRAISDNLTCLPRRNTQYFLLAHLVRVIVGQMLCLDTAYFKLQPMSTTKSFGHSPSFRDLAMALYTRIRSRFFERGFGGGSLYLTSVSLLKGTSGSVSTEGSQVLVPVGHFNFRLGLCTAMRIQRCRS